MYVSRGVKMYDRPQEIHRFFHRITHSLPELAVGDHLDLTTVSLSRRRSAADYEAIGR